MRNECWFTVVRLIGEEVKNDLNLLSLKASSNNTYLGINVQDIAQQVQNTAHHVQLLAIMLALKP